MAANRWGEIRTEPNNLILFQHYFGGLNNRFHRVTDLKFHLVRAASSDYAFNYVASHANDNMGHDSAQLNLFDFSCEFVAC